MYPLSKIISDKSLIRNREKYVFLYCSINFKPSLIWCTGRKDTLRLYLHAKTSAMQAFAAQKNLTDLKTSHIISVPCILKLQTGSMVGAPNIYGKGHLTTNSLLHKREG